MHFGIAFANTGPFARPDAAVEFARAAEDAGFESIWTVEHVVVPSGYTSAYPYDPSGKMPGPDDMEIPDPLIWLAYVAAATERLRLATGILILPQRNPVVLAKEVATLDVLSGGRMMLGIGAGWLEEEFDAIGVPFAERGRRTDENAAALRALWNDERASFDGEFVSFTECVMRPQPVNGTVPIHVGGHTDVAARRAGRLGDGFFPGKGSHQELARSFAIVREEAERHGRDPSAIEMTVGGQGLLGDGALVELEALVELGVHRVMIPAFMFWGDVTGSMSRFHETVIGPYREALQ